MRDNWHTQISGAQVTLVPYEAKHVERYHAWMQCPDLQELTGSEPLTLEDEYRMQETWRDSQDKCTFIILQRGSSAASTNDLGSMVGDTNLFLSTDEDSVRLTAEAEIMIAEPSARGHGLGWEAMAFMLRYGLETLGVQAFEAKIKIGNEPSLRMFKKLGFQETSRSEVFGEVTLQVEVTSEWRKSILEWTDGYQTSEYKH
eukprot:snap_masked-scaffold367_size194084-processed-gene-0.32 protein:Tk00504 transcript:snap_masked-scaffold367_size194084-processed-gene-0.32-mRNA-1 annotation:"n-acetyltransferase 9-like"